MSAIVGIVDWSGADRSAELSAMLQVFRRSLSGGVDSAKSGEAALGVNGLATENRPATAEDIGGVIAVVDARFDDREALAARVGLERDVSDSRIVIAAHERWGPEFPRHLRGDFAAIVWDTRARRLVAARDPFGIRPLYYSPGPGRLVLASDPEQILASGVISGEPDDVAVVDYLTWSFSTRERSFFENVTRLRGGHVLVATPMSLLVSDYRRLEVPDRRHPKPEDWRREYQTLFFAAVRKRLRSDHPIVAHLSGGLDSTSIACVADAIVATEKGVCPSITAVAGVYPGLTADETPFIRAAAAALHISTETWDGTLADPHELDDVVVSGPFGRYVQTGGTQGDVEIAHKLGACVALSGTGGDQLGVPVGLLQDAIIEGRWGEARRFIVDAPGATSRSALRTFLRVGKSMSPAWMRALHRPSLSEERQASWMTPWALSIRRPVVDLDPPPAGTRTFLQKGVWAALTQARHLSSIEYAQQHSFRSGVEVRFPFMDLDLALFVLSVPSSLWPPPWPQERLHREALAAVLPPVIRERRSKAPFVMALANRVRRQLPSIADLFESKSWHAERFVDQSTARRALRRFEADARPNMAAIWAVWGPATLEAWLRAVSRYNDTRLGGP